MLLGFSFPLPNLRMSSMFGWSIKFQNSSPRVISTLMKTAFNPRWMLASGTTVVFGSQRVGWVV